MGETSGTPARKSRKKMSTASIAKLPKIWIKSDSCLTLQGVSVSGEVITDPAGMAQALGDAWALTVAPRHFDQEAAQDLFYPLLTV